MKLNVDIVCGGSERLANTGNFDALVDRPIVLWLIAQFLIIGYKFLYSICI